jgi:hypothetical protein
VDIGARNASHLADYQMLFSFDLDAEDQAAISEVGVSVSRLASVLGTCLVLVDK